MPVGLMVWGPAMTDDAVLGVSLTIEAALATRPVPGRGR
jgi:Asp-tRNA(Asn)/Glu-tRNA(Gln) amidotransferase A subunit family amidase